MESEQSSHSYKKGGLSRREGRRDDRERQLVEAALSCIAERGLSETTVQAVASAADMAVGSINQYFDSKARLLTAVLKQLAEEFEQGWRQALQGAPPDAATRLAAFVGCYFSTVLCQRKKIAVWFAFWGEVKARPRYREVCAEYDLTHDEVLEQLCADLIRDGGYDALDARSVAKLIASTCHGLWLELLTGQSGLQRRNLAALAAESLAMVFPRHASVFNEALVER